MLANIKNVFRYASGADEKNSPCRGVLAKMACKKRLNVRICDIFAAPAWKKAVGTHLAFLYTSPLEKAGGLKRKRITKNKNIEMEELIMTPVVRKNQSWLPDVFNDLFDTNWMPRVSATAPAVNVIETANDYRVELAAPGYTKNDFDIKIDEENNLVISMEKKEEKKEDNGEKKEDMRYLRREFSYSKFQQAMILPEDVQKDKISAKVEHGVLTVFLPKQTPEEKKKAEKQIEIL